MDNFKRPIYENLLKRFSKSRPFIQVLAGARQVGKTTLARQVTEALDYPNHFASADEPLIHGTQWLENQWNAARLYASREGRCLLVLDEIQKIPHWSNVIKRLWDEDAYKKIDLRVLLLGSAPLLLQQGLGESLAGRFEVIHVPHWSFNEMYQAFGFNLEQYIFFGGYPGTASLIHDPSRFSNYVKESLIETTLSRDILLMTRVDKPALLRQLFQLGCHYSGQILSYQKMLGQLTDAGNTTTLAHYLTLLRGAGMLTGLPKYVGPIIRQRASSPKLQVLNNALMTAQLDVTLEKALENTTFWGRLVESAVGAHLYNIAFDVSAELYYWREDNREVDFVIKKGNELVALEVKSGKKLESLPGIANFCKKFPVKRTLQIGGQGIPLKIFFMMTCADLFK